MMFSPFKGLTVERDCAHAESINQAVWQDRVLAAELRAAVRQSHQIAHCFDFLPAERRDDPALSCEVSAIIYHDGELLFLNDKPLPALPVALRASIDSKGGLSPLIAGTFSPLDQATKFEAAAQAVDDPIDFAITAFDRFDPAHAGWDRFNAFFYWPRGRVDQAQLIQSTERESVVSSIKLRSVFESVIKTPYFKIEGLAALPGRRLMFGIRETGLSFREPKFRFLVSINYDKSIELLDEVSVLADWSARDLIGGETIADPSKDWGLSSIEYCADKDQLFFLLSAESKKGMEGFLLTQHRAQFLAGARPVLVRDQKGAAIHFSHKPEGMAVIGSDCRLLIAHDD
ncbi:MAG: hypothetical protein EB017_12355, partial [Betaproteobacteria bacterium]|nr:hypothetical protein [Betaproteobacteria bacterium]